MGHSSSKNVSVSSFSRLRMAEDGMFVVVVGVRHVL